MATYYVAANGDDTAIGSQASPWKTVNKVNAMAADHVFKLGDSVLFKRGDTFYGRVYPPDYLDPAYAGWFVIGAYGTGVRPVLSSYKILTIASAWTVYDTTTWQIDLSNTNAGVTYSGYDNAKGGDANVGFIKVDGTLYGYRKFSLAALNNQWDFFVSGTVLYVRSSVKPTTLASDIRVSTDGIGVQLRSATEVNGLRIEGSGSNAVDAPGVSGSSVRCRVIDCEMAEVGGSVLTGFGDGTTRYGNGVQGWIGTRDMVVERNIIHDCYDVALTLQGGSGSNPGAFTNVVFRNNLVYRNNQSIEFWSGGTGNTGNGFINCVVEYNTCLFAGYAWSSNARPDQTTRVHLLTYGWTLPAAIQVRHNIFYDAHGAYRFSQDAPTGMVCSQNQILQRPSGLLKVGTAKTIEQGQLWTASENNDVTSRFVTLPSSALMSITDSDVTNAIAWLNKVAGGRLVRLSGNRVRAVPIHQNWKNLVI